MNIDKNDVVKMLESQGEHGRAKAKHAKRELPHHVDTDNTDHQNLLSKFGIEPAELVNKFGGDLPGGLGKLL